jgi:hypothetical protein
MALTTAQLAILKAAILADATLNAQTNTNVGNSVIADTLNTSASPDFWVWRTSVSKDEYVGATSVDGTTFSWTGAGFITRSQGERDAFREIFSAAGTCNPSLPSVRAAFTDIFSGATAPAPANRTHLATVSRRKALAIEKLFATGTGSTASPATMGREGVITPDDIEQARSS